MSWIEELFLRHADLFLQVAKRREERTDDEVEALDTLFSEMDVQKNARVLDLYCGYGRHAVRLAKKGYHVTGVDLSPHSNIDTSTSSVLRFAMDGGLNSGAVRV